MARYNLLVLKRRPFFVGLAVVWLVSGCAPLLSLFTHSSNLPPAPIESSNSAPASPQGIFGVNWEGYMRNENLEIRIELVLHQSTGSVLNIMGKVSSPEKVFSGTLIGNQRKDGTYFLQFQSSDDLSTGHYVMYHNKEKDALMGTYTPRSSVAVPFSVELRRRR